MKTNLDRRDRKRDLIKSVLFITASVPVTDSSAHVGFFPLPVLKRLKQTCREEEAEGGSKHPCILTVYPHP